MVEFGYGALLGDRDVFTGEMTREDQDRMDSRTTETNDPEIEARLAAIETRIEYPLTAQQVAIVTKRIAQSIELGKALRAYPLTNADEPEIGFVPFRGGE